MRFQNAAAPLALALALISPAGSAPARYRTVSLPTNSVVEVRLNQTVGSDRNRSGDRFTATVHDASLPEGTIVRGVIIGANKASKEKPGKLGLDFQSLELPNGRRVAIAGSPTSLDSDSVTRGANGRLVARKRSKSTGKYVAIGAAGGLLVGSLLGKNVVGGLLGAGAGYLLGHKKDKKAEQRDVVLKEGTKLGVRLDRSVVVARR